jgi:hypothetical protein
MQVRYSLVERGWWDQGFWQLAGQLSDQWAHVDNERRTAEVRAGLERACKEKQAEARALAEELRQSDVAAAAEAARVDEKALHKARLDEERERQIDDEAWAMRGLKADASAIRVVLEVRGIAYVWHWTENRNLESILRRGLLSPADQAREGVRAVTHGYGHWYKEQRLSDYVGFGFRPHWGMIAGADDPIVFGVGAAVVARTGAAYSIGNTASRAVEIDAALRQTSAEDLEHQFARDGSLVDWQAEVWVPSPIERWRLRRVVFRSEEQQATAVSRLPAGLVRSDAIARSIVDPRHFEPGAGCLDAGPAAEAAIELDLPF